jgi:hypothetical protein
MARPTVLRRAPTVHVIPRALLALALIAGAGTRAGAAPAAAPPAPGAAGVGNVDEARQRFRRGVELHAEGDLEGALVEFLRAYELSPSYKILYNVAQIAYQRQDYVTALRYFTRYLNEGGADVPRPRRNEVEDEIARLRLRTGWLDVHVPEPGAELIVDEVSVGTTPLPAPVAVNLGRRRVEIAFPNGERRVRVVDVAGGETVIVSFAAVPPPRLAPLASTAAAAPAPTLLLAGAPEAPARPPRRAPPRSSHWLGWTAAGVLAAAAGTTGALAMLESRDLEHERDTFPASADTLNRTHRDMRILALTTDGLAIGSALVAALTLYFTVRTPTGGDRAAE